MKWYLFNRFQLKNKIYNSHFFFLEKKKPHKKVKKQKIDLVMSSPWKSNIWDMQILERSNFDNHLFFKIQKIAFYISKSTQQFIVFFFFFYISWEFSVIFFFIQLQLYHWSNYSFFLLSIDKTPGATLSWIRFCYWYFSLSFAFRLKTKRKNGTPNKQHWSNQWEHNGLKSNYHNFLLFFSNNKHSTRV